MLELGLNSEMNKSAVITGVSSGIGRGIAKHLLDSRYNVIGLSRSKCLDSKIIEHPNYSWIHYDAQKSSTLSRVTDALSENKVELLVNCAGVFTPDTEGFTENSLTEHMKINFFAPSLLTQTLMPNLRAAEKSRVINISSASGVRIKNGNLSYNASKHALEALTKTINKNERENNVFSTSIQPSIVATPMAKYHLESGKSALPVSDIVSIVEMLINLSNFAHIESVKVTIGPE